MLSLYRVFVSHATSDVALATKVAEAMSRLDVSSFVAGRDVPPGMEWRPVINAALSECSALVALLSASFRMSEWTDQEVGFVIGRARPIVPLSITGVDPHGLLGAYQKIELSDSVPSQWSGLMFNALYSSEKDQRPLTDIIIRRTRLERNETRLKAWIDRLGKATYLTLSQADSLRQSLVVNTALRFNPALTADVRYVLDSCEILQEDCS
jgi:hypothetical protein